MGDRYRKQLRLKAFDYREPGAYFVTICVANREPLLGTVHDGVIVPNEIGVAVESTLLDMPDRFHGCLIDSYVVMPNHVHVVILLGAVAEWGANFGGEGGASTAPTKIIGDADFPVVTDSVGAGLAPPSNRPRLNPSLADVIRAFKSISAIRANQLLGRSRASFWQRNYYEHIIRNDAALDRIREYIANNPANWADDEENPVRWA